MSFFDADARKAEEVAAALAVKEGEDKFQKILAEVSIAVELRAAVIQFNCRWCSYAQWFPVPCTIRFNGIATVSQSCLHSTLAAHQSRTTHHVRMHLLSTPSHCPHVVCCACFVFQKVKSVAAPGDEAIRMEYFAGDAEFQSLNWVDKGRVLLEVNRPLLKRADAKGKPTTITLVSALLDLGRGDLPACTGATTACLS